MPANGISIAATLSLPSAPSTHCEPGVPPVGQAVLMRTSDVPNSTAKSTPATAAARGVDNRLGFGARRSVTGSS